MFGGLVADEGVVAADVITCRASIHHAHVAAERGPLLPALVRGVSLPAVTAVDDLNDGLDDLAAGAGGWGGQLELGKVEVVKFHVASQTCCVELMRKFAPGEEVVAPAILHVALAFEIILANHNGALSGVGLLNSSGPIALVLVLGAMPRGLVRLVRDLDEVKRLPAQIATFSTFATFSALASFASFATAHSCASKIAVLLVLAGQGALTVHATHQGEESAKRVEGKILRRAQRVELLDGGVLFGRGAVPSQSPWRAS